MKPKLSDLFGIKIYMSVKVAILLGFSLLANSLMAGDFENAINTLKLAKVDAGSQVALQQAWQEITQCDVDSIIAILSAMKGVGPNAENWMRAAVEKISEKSHLAAVAFPAMELEQFLKDSGQSPRARFLAYELLNSVDPTLPERLLSNFLDDPSSELRYEAIAQAIARAENEPTDADKISAYNRVIKSARDKDQISQCIDALKELGVSPDLTELFGYLKSWKLLGPFDNQANQAYEQLLEAERELDFTKTYSGLSSEVNWKEFSSEESSVDKLGLVNLNKQLEELKEVAALAATTFDSSRDQEVEIRYSSKNATKLYVNGSLVAANPVYHSGSSFDQYIVPVSFKQGPNQILLKVCQNAQKQPWARGWEFQLRVTDELGGAILSNQNE